MGPVVDAVKGGKNPLATSSLIPESSFWSGTPAYNQNFNLLTPQQQQLQGGALQGAQNLLQGGQNPLGNSFDFQPIADEARSNFYSETVPTLAERFSGMGAGGQGSSDFRGAIGAAGTGLDKALASLKQQYGMQQQGMNQNLLSILLSGGLGTRSFENAHFPRQPGFAENFGTNVLGGAANAATKLAGTALFL